MEVAFGKELSERWQGQRPDAWNADLAAVGVSGQDKVDEWAAAVVCDVDREVGHVNHEDDGSVGFFGDRHSKIGLAVGVVVQTAEKDVLALSLDAHELIDEHGQPVVFHVVANDAPAYGCIMVAKNAESLRAGKFAEQLGTPAGGFI